MWCSGKGWRDSGVRIPRFPAVGVDVERSALARPLDRVPAPLGRAPLEEVEPVNSTGGRAPAQKSPDRYSSKLERREDFPLRNETRTAVIGGKRVVPWGGLDPRVW